jgi:hypothetical protein
VGDHPDLTQLIKNCRQRADHLEMRDGYTVHDLAYAAWTRGEFPRAGEHYRSWIDLIISTTHRGVAVRRVRIVSEPASDYIRFEHHITTEVNIAAGETVRWLPRRKATDLALPGNDFWLFDDTVLLVHHFSGDGDKVGTELVRDTEVIGRCVAAFDAVWQRATPHVAYQPT